MEYSRGYGEDVAVRGTILETARVSFVVSCCTFVTFAGMGKGWFILIIFVGKDGGSLFGRTVEEFLS